MSEDLLLTELCMICHTQAYKYCCPRCSSKTCSLPCIKRHKQWASCTGIRDPAAYIKRSDLATAKAIDHDYNYLTSIERQIDTAERDFESRGIRLFDELQDNRKRRGPQAAKGEIPLRRAIEQCRVVVDRAPKGMSRQKQNATKWDKKNRRIVWTVEWVHKNGRREIGQCPETQTIEDAYSRLTIPKPTNEWTNPQPPQKKHKPNGDISRPAALTVKSHSQEPSPQRTQSAELEDNQDPTTTNTDPANDESSLPLANSSQPSPPPVHFYLLLPSTPTSYRVLIPLSSSDALSMALTDRLVLEFPTIYALKQPPDKLPTGFMTEEEYLRGIAEKGHMNRHLDGLLNGIEAWGNDGTQNGGESNLDESALRDVLKKDLVREVDVA